MSRHYNDVRNRAIWTAGNVDIVLTAMMRLSCLTLSYQNQFKAGKMDIFSFLTTCRALDLDGADIHINSLMNKGRPHLKEVRRKALDQGLSISCLGVSTEFGRSAE